MSLITELVRIERLPRWRKTHLVTGDDRLHLLEGSVRHLFNSRRRLVDTAVDSDGELTDEAMQVRVLLLWLAWSLGEQVPLAPSDGFDTENQQSLVQTKGMFLALAPTVAIDDVARNELLRCISATQRPNPAAVARAERWLHDATEFGQTWSRELTDAPTIEVGGCCFAGKCQYPFVVCRANDGVIGLWDYGDIRSFQSMAVLPVQPQPAG